MRRLWGRVVAVAWFVTAGWFLVVRVNDLLNPPFWGEPAAEHLRRYPAEMVVIVLAAIIAVVSTGAAIGNNLSIRLLRLWCWLVLLASFSLAIAVAIVTVLENGRPEPATVYLIGIGLLGWLSIAILQTIAKDPSNSRAPADADAADHVS